MTHGPKEKRKEKKYRFRLHNHPAYEECQPGCPHYKDPPPPPPPKVKINPTPMLFSEKTTK
jgi:hypothetical protein